MNQRDVYLNNEFVPWEKANVHLMCHSFGRGSAIFEVISFYEINGRSAVFRLDQHIQRLFRTAELLNMEIPLTPESLQGNVLETIKRTGIREGFIKIIGFYPQVSFRILPPQKSLDIAVFIIDPVQDIDVADLSFEQGTTMCISKWRKLDPQTVPISAKASANYLNGMLAQAEAQERGFKMGMLLDTQGFIAEGGTESVFLVKNDRLMTPSRGTVLESITRKSLIQLSRANDIEVLEDRLHPDLFFTADECFMASTVGKVLPVVKIEDRTIENSPGPVSRRLNALMEEILTGKSEGFKEWLFYV